MNEQKQVICHPIPGGKLQKSKDKYPLTTMEERND